MTVVPRSRIAGTLGALVIAAGCAAGCGGRYPDATRPTATAGPGGARMGEGATGLGKGGIEAAALPYVVLDGRTGR